ncbi:hypothetical protein M409DRAFT_29402 [Zasmidium cellare ATCC 36951]|uniref:Cyclase n=1 Tax=Zasmidium cellare ATCC 36951 TaxID=1080233 RepID=A0A6A6BZF7_ZASCE|nr:uncharacterized protein M409DRAFT_29402 [Zasmidium cellare ATCC 36951]KAF2160105.1 hypothetical protein M409DRAFT_29402 [Zasmidium cellare ATCC 36951]
MSAAITRQDTKTEAPVRDSHTSNGCDSDHTEEPKEELPTFEQLPLRPNDPPYSAWGLWGEDDELGRLNLLTPEVVKSAALEIQHGIRIPLNLPLDFLARPMNPAREPCIHRINAKGRANDDSLQMDTQGSSHFDGLRHVPYLDFPEKGSVRHYNGVTQEQISGPQAGDKLGIHNAAQTGIVARGVLLDWYRYALKKGIEFSPLDSHRIPLWQLQEVAREQGVTFRQGDVLIIRTGWTVAYSALSHDEKLALPYRDPRTACGLEASKEFLKWHWENGFAAVASDTVAYEAMPFIRPAGACMHEVFLSGWGMMIGESWDLEELSRQCGRLQRWTFFFSSQPLNVVAGVASPCNAMAIL